MIKELDACKKGQGLLPNKNEEINNYNALVQATIDKLADLLKKTELPAETDINDIMCEFKGEAFLIEQQIKKCNVWSLFFTSKLFIPSEQTEEDLLVESEPSKNSIN